MFGGIFQPRSAASALADADSSTIRSDDTPKSILRSRFSKRNAARTVSWSETFETLERDGTFGTRGDGTFDDGTFDDGTFDGRCELELDTFRKRRDASRGDFDRARDDDAATFEAREARDRSEAAAAGASEGEPIDDNENSELRNLACASNASEATETADKYGLDEADAKMPKNRILPECESYTSEVSEFRDKYGGFDDEVSEGAANAKCAEEAPVSAEASAPASEAETSVAQENSLSPIAADDVDVFVPGEPEAPLSHEIEDAPSSDSLTVGTLSLEDADDAGASFDFPSVGLGRIRPSSDEGSLSSLKKPEHGYEGAFEEQRGADRSHGHIGLILPFLSRLRCGAFAEEVSMFESWEEDGVEGGRGEEDAARSGSRVFEEVPNDDVAEDEIEVVDGTATSDERFAGESEVIVETITSLSDEEQDDSYIVHHRKIDEYDATFGAVGGSTEEDATASTSSDQGQSAKDETSNQESEPCSKSPTNSSSSHSPSEVKSQKPQQSNDDESPCIGHVISFPAVEDDSIPSNESYDDSKENRSRNKKAFKPLASLRKRVSRAASSIVSKNTKGKKKPPSKRKQHTPQITYTSESLHDRVYHDNRPATQSRVTTELILNDLQIIEDTAKVMYQDRFNNTPSPLNPVDESSGNFSEGKRWQKARGCDDASEMTKKTAQSRLSGVFDGYFAPEKR